MSVIPSDLRAPVTPVNGLSLRGMFAATPAARTLGVAAAGVGVSAAVGAGGIRSACLVNASCAVGATRLEKRGDRIWGVPCVGTGPVAVAQTQAVSWRYYVTSAEGPSTLFPRGEYSYGYRQITNTFPWLLSLTLNCAACSFNWRSSLVAGWQKTGVFYATVQPGETWWVEGIKGSMGSGTDQTDIYITTTPIGAYALPDWRDAVSALEWATGNLPWWGGAEAAARAGTWVRRASWSDLSRAVRFEAGAGTTRAVAVSVRSGQLVPERVTTSDFGAAEFLADDWELLGQADPMPIDVTDWVFHGAGAVPFAVLPASDSGGTPQTPTVPPAEQPGTAQPGTVLPASGRGFVYLKDGTLTLVPAKDVSGASWEPA